MDRVEIIDMTFNEIVELDGKEKNEALKYYREYLITVINKLYMEVSKYKNFSFSKNEDDMTLKEIAHELYNFLESKNYSKEQINEIITKRVKR